MKKGLFMVIALLAVSCLMAAGAYTSATVSNAASLAVATTDTALVALTATHVGADVGFEDATVDTSSNVLSFNFNKGRLDANDGDNDQYGLQKDSVYTWWDDTNAYGLFQVTNNSKDTVQLTVTEKETTNDTNIDFDFIMGIERGVTDYDSGWKDTGVSAGYYSVTFNDESAKLAPGETAEIGVRINVLDSATNALSFFDIDVTAEAVTPPPA
ncbi:hypothetical protein SAMN05660649_02811 [Desulfotomaculum arcticum]|uniref:Camelysin metallo-endopeptidase n=1 Tax=Desulfotruncus arcticus DSM 17038 TaxID=1121424 RepID=A0A1I2V512_9FIRM|nr:hypothetical protein [Desulfotruncus arcticus]SFG82346.1 hypothetical protein SAMN05660649_02811 [Desulfotomaculum arcticum] [Desulfotruncus arcticus DSM 17038]